MIPVIDMWSPIVPSREIIDHIAGNFPVEQLQYLEVFTKRHVTDEEFAVYAAGLAREDTELLESLDEAGIRKSLVTGFNEKSTCGRTFVTNEAVEAIVRRHPSRFIPFCGVDIFGDDPVGVVRHWIEDRGFRGVSLRPFMIGHPPVHPKYEPILAEASRLGVPVSVHTSANWTRTRPSDLGHPKYLDDVACRYPDLTLIMSHAGYPWVLEACLTAWKHPNVYLELGAHRPRYFAAPGAGWDALMRFGATTIRDKVIYGTGAFLINRPYKFLCDEMRELPLDEDVLEAWLWRNAARLMGLDSLER